MSSLHFLILTNSLNGFEDIGKVRGSGTFLEIMFSITYVTVTGGDSFPQFCQVFEFLSTGIPESA